jgi:large subunit ribosomal protein L21
VKAGEGLTPESLLELPRRLSRRGEQNSAQSGHGRATQIKSFVISDSLWQFPRLSKTGIPSMAYAIIRSGGKQYRVAPGDIIAVEKLNAASGDQVVFDEVVLQADGDNITVGNPVIAGAQVTGELIEQFKDKKVIAFKYKRRKGYHRTVGHRRRLTRVKINSIV